MSCAAKGLLLFCLTFALILSSEAEAAFFSAIENGGFELGTTAGWLDQSVDIQGELSVGGGILAEPSGGEYQAIMSPYGITSSSLRQRLNTNADKLTIAFDFRLRSITPFIEDILSGHRFPADIFEVGLTGDNSFHKEVLWLHIPEVYGNQEISGWLHYENEFECNGAANLYLEFKLDNFNNPYQFSTAFIDNVQVTFVPIPSALLLLGPGLIGIYCRRIRQQK